MSTDDITAGLLGNTDPIFKFESVGDKIDGTVVSIDKVQRTDIDGALQTWDNGEPKMQYLIKLATALRDPDVDDDDGTRRIFTKYEFEKAFGAALRKAGVTAGDSLIGGRLVAKHSGVRKSDRKGYSDTKLFECAYVAPVKDAADDLLGGEAPADDASSNGLSADDLA